jgi:lipopolysaccharide transport system ATP-binding protein
MNDIAISVKNLSKSFRMYPSPKERIKEMLHPFNKKYHREFWALKDISFDIKKGETVGIIGRNGSGKSTLLQILCGILQPTEGEVKVHGRISALLELGAGFSPQFTGRENVYMNGAIMGFTNEEMDERFQLIAEFADIGEFIDQPVRVYSSGMYVRLAFAAAINVDPDVFIVYEDLGVGDAFFQQKCITVIKKMIADGVTLVFVSHDAGTIKSVCNKCLWLDHGKALDFNSSEVVTEKYFSRWLEQFCEKNPASSNGNSGNGLQEKRIKTVTNPAFEENRIFNNNALFQRLQNGKANLLNVQLLDVSGKTVQTVGYEQVVTLRMAVSICEDIDVLGYGFWIRNAAGVNVVHIAANIENTILRAVKKGERFIINSRFKTPLQQGNYTIACYLSIPLDDNIFASVVLCDYVPIAVQFEMLPRSKGEVHGLIHLENEITIEKYKEDE